MKCFRPEARVLSPMKRPDPAFPLRGAEGSDAVVNDSPVGCQSRGVTEPWVAGSAGSAAAGESCLRSRLREFLRGLLPSDASRGIGVCHLPLRGRLEEVLLGSDFGFPGDSV